MDITTQCKFFGKKVPWKVSLLLLPLLLPVAAHAEPPPSGPMMGQHMMNNENMRQYMQESGYGYGRGRGYGGWMGGMMGGYGPMMGGGYGPMMGDMMGGGFGPMMGGMMGGFYGLDLSKDQRAKIRSLHHAVRKQNMELMSKLMDSRDKLAELYDTAKPDPDKIGKVYDEIFKIRREMIQQHLKVRNKIYDLLTEDQRKEIDSERPFGYGHMGGMMQ